jgi:hypothetical protein
MGNLIRDYRLTKMLRVWQIIKKTLNSKTLAGKASMATWVMATNSIGTKRK